MTWERKKRHRRKMIQHSAGRRIYVRENLEGKNGGSAQTEKVGYERLA